MSINDKGHSMQPLSAQSSKKKVGKQGTSSKSLGGSKIANVNNPRGVQPVKMKSPKTQLTQEAVQGKVGGNK